MYIALKGNGIFKGEILAIENTKQLAVDTAYKIWCEDYKEEYGYEKGCMPTKKDIKIIEWEGNLVR